MKNATMETIHNQLQQIISNQVTKDYFVGVINKLTSRIRAQEEQIKDIKERVNQKMKTSLIVYSASLFSWPERLQ